MDKTEILPLCFVSKTLRYVGLYETKLKHPKVYSYFLVIPSTHLHLCLPEEGSLHSWHHFSAWSIEVDLRRGDLQELRSHKQDRERCLEFSLWELILFKWPGKVED